MNIYKSVARLSIPEVVQFAAILSLPMAGSGLMRPFYDASLVAAGRKYKHIKSLPSSANGEDVYDGGVYTSYKIRSTRSTISPGL